MAAHIHLTVAKSLIFKSAGNPKNNDYKIKRAFKCNWAAFHYSNINQIVDWWRKKEEQIIKIKKNKKSFFLIFYIFYNSYATLIEMIRKMYRIYYRNNRHLYYKFNFKHHQYIIYNKSTLIFKYCVISYNSRKSIKLICSV